MATPITMTVGHIDNMSIAYFDTNGNPMLITPTPDSPPTWTNAPSPAGAAVLAVAPGGLTATDTAVSDGADTVSMGVVVGGATFTDTLAITITAATQVLGSVQIVSNVVASPPLGSVKIVSHVK